jgi:hypothetical protein
VPLERRAVGGGIGDSARHAFGAGEQASGHQRKRRQRGQRIVLLAGGEGEEEEDDGGPE